MHFAIVQYPCGGRRGDDHPNRYEDLRRTRDGCGLAGSRALPGRSSRVAGVVGGFDACVFEDGAQADPFSPDDKPLRYMLIARALPGGLDRPIVYSVGPNGVDDTAKAVLPINATVPRGTLAHRRLTTSCAIWSAGCRRRLLSRRSRAVLDSMWHPTLQCCQR